MTEPADPNQPQPTPIVSWQPPTDQPGPAAGVSFASHGPRLVAYLLDGLIIGAFIIVLSIVAAIIGVGIAASVSPTSTGARAAAGVGFLGFGLVVLVVTLGYFPYFWTRTGQTPGMKPFNLYVVRDRDGGRISGGQAVLRLIGMWVSAFVFYLGYIWVFIDSRRRGWHDLIAGTVVVERRS